MLEVGNGLALPEERTHFALWALMKSPLMIGARLSSLTDAQLEILKNPRLIAFNQDPFFGAPAAPYKWGTNPDWTFNASFPAQYWAGESEQGVFVALFNSDDKAVNMTADFGEIPSLKGRRHRVTDVWTGESVGLYSDRVTVGVEGHDTAVLLLPDT